MIRHDGMQNPGTAARDLLREVRNDVDFLNNTSFASPERIAAFIEGDAPITPSLAFTLSKISGTSAGYWMNLQKHYDVSIDNALSPAASLERETQLIDIIEEYSGKRESIEAINTLGEQHELTGGSLSYLLGTALRAESVPELQASLQSLAAHRPASAELVAGCMTNHENENIANESLHLLYGISPELGIRRAYDALQDPSSPLKDTAEELLKKYLRHDIDFESLSVTETTKAATAYIEEMIASGNGHFKIIQPEGSTFQTDVVAFRNYQSNEETNRIEAIKSLRDHNAEAAELLALDAVLSTSSQLRKVGLVTLQILNSEHLLEEAQALSNDSDTTLAKLAQLLAKKHSGK